MKLRFIFYFVLFSLFASCQGNTSNSIKEEYSATIKKTDSSFENYPDGIYCAEVNYHNPNTSTSSNYTLTVDIKNNKLLALHWPNGGELDQEHFSTAQINSKGYTTFKNSKGYIYKVQITGPADNCFKDVPMVKQCKGFTKRGDRCKHMTDNSSGLCWQHQNKN